MHALLPADLIVRAPPGVNISLKPNVFALRKELVSMDDKQRKTTTSQALTE